MKNDILIAFHIFIPIHLYLFGFNGMLDDRRSIYTDDIYITNISIST